MGILSKLIKTGLVLGTVYTAYQASEKTKKQTGGFKTEEFIQNFKDQAAENSKMVVDAVKAQLTGEDSGYTVSGKGENGYTYKDAADAPKDPAPDKVNEVFETIKEKAPEVIDKVHDFVDDVRENAPEYKAKAQEFVEDVKEAAKKALDTDTDSDSKEDK